MTQFYAQVEAENEFASPHEYPADGFSHHVLRCKKLSVVNPVVDPSCHTSNECNRNTMSPRHSESLKGHCTIPSLKLDQKTPVTAQPHLPSIAQFLNKRCIDEKEELQRLKKERRRLQVREASRRMRKRHQDELIALRKQVSTLQTQLEKKDLDHQEELLQKEKEIQQLMQQVSLASLVDSDQSSKSSVRFLVE